MARRKAWDFSRLLPAQLIWPWSNSFLVMMPKRQLLFRFFSAYFRKPQQISQTLVKKNAPAPLRLWRMQRGLKRASPLTQCNRFILKCFTNNVHSCRLQLAICFFHQLKYCFFCTFSFCCLLTFALVMAHSPATLDFFGWSPFLRLTWRWRGWEVREHFVRYWRKIGFRWRPKSRE